MEIQLTLNGEERAIRCQPGDSLFRVLRREGGDGEDQDVRGWE